jgi:bifunctional UDP-N-acetylglucosamine pyrophosphorylase/glucosamine-1-phosphate N-acetyltransferase
MIPVAGQYVIDHIISLLKGAGVNDINIVVGHKKEKMREHLSGTAPHGVSLHFVDQGKPEGIGKAILKARSRFSPGENILLVYADTMTTNNIFNVAIQSFGLSNEPTAAICLTESGEKYGNVYLDSGTKITKIIEKPGKKEGLGNYVLAGVFVLPFKFFDFLDKAGADMEQALKTVIKSMSLRAAIWDGDWLDMAYPWDILTANKSIMDTWTFAQVHQSVTIAGSELKGPVHISEGVEIMSGVVLEGPAYIGPGSFIGHNTLIRPYTCIGANSVIGYGAELKNCVIFPNAQVGRSCFIGDSVIGEGVKLGAGVMTINHRVDQSDVSVKINKAAMKTGMSKLGAFIGDGAVVGALNSIAAGTVIEAGRIIDHNCSVC